MLSKQRLIVSLSYLLAMSALVSSSGVRASDGASRYVNSEYGFSVQIPPGRPTCRAEPGTHDTGVMIFLDQGPSDCAKQNQRPFIAVNGTYNATDAPNALEALSIVCGSAKPQPTDAHVFGDAGKRWPTMCRIQQEGGLVEYILIRQNRPVAADATPTINYSIIVHVPAGDSQAMKEARLILQSVRVKSSG